MKSIIHRIKNNKTIINGSLFSIFSFFNQGISFILLILLAKYITPSEYGYLSIFNTIVMFLGYFIALSTQGYISVSYFQKGKNNFKKDFSCIVFIAIGILIILSLIILIGKENLSSILIIDQELLWIALLISFFHLLFNINLDLFRIKELVLKYGYRSCGFALLNFILSIYLVIYCNYSWQGRVYAQLLCTCIWGGLAILYFTKEKLFTFNLSQRRFKEIIIWGLPLIPHLATHWIRQGCDRYIINYNYSIEEVGLFSFALNLASVIYIIGMAFNSTNSVEIYKTLSSKTMTNESKIKSLFNKEKNLVLLYIICFIIILLSGIIFIPIILPKYTNSILYFCILSIYGLLQCFYFIYSNYLFYYKKNKNIMYITFSSSILHLLLSICLTGFSLYITASIYVITQLYIVISIRNKAKQIILKEIQ